MPLLPGALTSLASSGENPPFVGIQTPTLCVLGSNRKVTLVLPATEIGMFAEPLPHELSIECPPTILYSYFPAGRIALYSYTPLELRVISVWAHFSSQSRQPDTSFCRLPTTAKPESAAEAGIDTRALAASAQTPAKEVPALVWKILCFIASPSRSARTASVLGKTELN